MSAADARTLSEVLRRESRSFLQYVRDADLWAAPSDRKWVADLRHLAETEAASLDRLAAFLQSRRVPLPGARAFPQAFTAFNFVNVRSVLPRLVAEQERDVRELERDIATLTDEWRGPAAELLALKRTNLEALHRLLV